MHDHFAITIGKNSILGDSCIIYAHALEKENYSITPVSIGSNVTIGANAVIMPGAVIEDGVILAAGSVLTKNKRIPAGEIWGGVPAKRIQAAATTISSNA